MSFNSSELVPYVVGAVITIAIARWLFSRVDNRPPNSPSLYFSYSPDPASVAELQSMFPNIPRAHIVRELDRANGVVSEAVDALVLMSSDYPANSSLPVSPDLGAESAKATQTTLKAIIEDLNANPEESVQEIQLNRKEWDSADNETRQRLLAERKKAMLLKAREAFRKSNDA